MITTRSVQYRQLTPDEVLAELRVYFRCNRGFSEADLAKYVNLESSLPVLAECEPDADWGDLEKYHGLEIPAGWSEAVTPMHTVGDLCELLAAGTQVPVIEPVTILGSRCETAGAFLTLKQMLADAGENVTDLGPSSELKPYLWARPEVFQWFRLATRRRLPPFDQMIPWPCFALLASLLCAGVAWLAKAEISACALVAVAITLLLVSVYMRPRFAPTFDGRRVTTFRDLIHAALERTPRARAV